MTKCSKCYSISDKRRYLKIKTNKGNEYVFCSKCAYDAYMNLLAIESRIGLFKDEKDLMKKLRKFN